MKDNSKIYLFVVAMSLGIAGFAIFLLVYSLGVPFYLIAIILFIIIVGYFRRMARKLTHKTYEQRFQRLKECDECKAIIPEDSLFCQVCGADLEEVLCEYCGHSNKPGSKKCEKCKAVIGE